VPADQIREPHAAWSREVPPALAFRQGEEQIGQGDVCPEPSHKSVTAISRPIAPLAFNAHDIQGNSPSECEPMRRGACINPVTGVSAPQPTPSVRKYHVRRVTAPPGNAE
jgi:hypothetical protein